MNIPTPTVWARLPLGLVTIVSTAARADEVNVAVAANFTAAMKEIATTFEQSTGHKAVLSLAPPVNLYPDRQWSAIRRSPRQTGEAATPGAGGLRAWTVYPCHRQAGSVEHSPVWPDEKRNDTRDGEFTRPAIANPQTAPYGAAMEVLGNGVSDDLAPRLVRGDRSRRTHQLVATGNAGARLRRTGTGLCLNPEGSRWLVPQNLYTPIRQDAVLLNSAAGARRPRTHGIPRDPARGDHQRYG